MRRRVTWLLVPLAWALACGGRFEQTSSGDSEPGTPSTGQGGSAPAKAGTASSSPGSPATGSGAVTSHGGTRPTGAGAATASGGAPIASAGAAVGGAFGTAGTFVVGTGGTGVTTGGSGVTTGGFPIGGDACGFAGETGVGGDLSCIPLDCVKGWVLVRLPNGLYECQPPSVACLPQREKYRQYRQLLLDKYSSYTCASNADCTVYYEKNACGVSSCGIPIAKALLANLDNNLDSYAQMACNAACPPEPQPPCDPSPAECFKGYCN